MKTILISDPDTDLLDIMCTALEMGGFRAIGFQDLSADLMGLIKYYQPDVVFLDYAYADRQCIESCSLIKSLYNFLPVLAVSCNHNIAETFTDSGFDDCISKPFNLDDLYAMANKYTNMI